QRSPHCPSVDPPHAASSTDSIPLKAQKLLCVCMCFISSMLICCFPSVCAGLFQFLPPDSREFEDLVKIISSFYLDASSRGTFSYCKARLIHNELLEKEFIEKRREMKQEGRTDQELTESYCFLYPDKSKLQWICEKGLSVGHCKISTLGNPAMGVYLSKYSDLLQINPFEVGSSGDIVIFKVMKGRIKHIYENMPKNAMEPTPKFDCHWSKSATRVSSLLSYRAFELTQQYFFEFAFDEIKARPRHVCPYAVVSFHYKGKEAAATPMTAHRYHFLGPLVNKGQELFPICLRSSSRPYLPFKLPEKLQINRAMQLEQVKRKIPPLLFSWDTYSMSREGQYKPRIVDKSGASMLFLTAASPPIIQVLVKSLFDRGFLFLLSSAQMGESKQPEASRLFEPERLTVDHQPAVQPAVEPFVPALHFALFKLRPNPGKDLSAGVERQATDYLTRMDSGTVRPFILPEYKYNVDERTNPPPAPRHKFNMEAVLRTYVHNPVNYILPVNKVKDIIERIRNPYSPVSDWGGSDRGSDRSERPAERPPLRLSQNEYDKDKMKQLLKLIQLHKKALVKDPGKEQGEDGAWDANSLKRKFEGEDGGAVNKRQRGDQLSNGEPSRGEAATFRHFSTCSLHRDEYFISPFPEPKTQPEPEPTAVTDGEPEPKTPAAVEVKKAAVSALAAVEEAPFRPSISLDTILNQEIHSLASDIKSIMQTQRVCYASQMPPRSPLRRCWLPNSRFSDFVTPFVSPVSVQGHVRALCEKMEKLIPAPPAPSTGASPPAAVTTAGLTPPAPVHTPKGEAELSLSKSSTSSHGAKTSAIKDATSSAEVPGDIYSPSQVTPDSPEQNSQSSGSAPAGGSGLLAGSLIGQLKPEVFSSLVEIFKDVTKNTVKFYIYSGDEGEESTVCKEIKGYLKSLGNSECSPQSFLENSGSLDKLLIIIQNEDIAAHVHKIPALMSLKKLPSVSFAGVDTLDDVKNHTYNELFVSGGFMVSDEFVLNPDLITQDRLLGLLKFLEEQSTPEHPWQWKVHCKSHKKLKELGRLNTNAMGLLNLLTTYQKKHLVEFLPYHECDTQSRQAPDLECLIKLQAQHTQQRHLIFLTERPFEMFLQYSRNGIVIASIDDVMSGFHSLIGSINQNELPTPPSTGG
uniref:Transcription activation suppressor b n=1 Tax=Salarias fasciatus TaxID=181472 RepID=A0A672HN93_SALFA